MKKNKINFFDKNNPPKQLPKNEGEDKELIAIVEREQFLVLQTSDLFESYSQYKKLQTLDHFVKCAQALRLQIVTQL